jgi:DTW domain-containing protein YfiP
MRSATAPDRVGHCPRCWQPSQMCLCPQPIVISVQLVIVRHWKEALKSSNTGRLAQLAIAGTQMLDYGAPGKTFDDSALRRPNTWLLFPPPDGLDAQARTDQMPSLPLAALCETDTPVEHLVVMDSTWPQARKLVRRISALATLPRAQIPPSPDPPKRLRKAPFPGAMATLEAIARAVEHIDGPDAARPLDALFARFVQQCRKRRGLPLN